MTHQNQHTPKSLLDDSLYCREENLEDDEYTSNFMIISPKKTTISNTPFVDFLEQDLFWDEQELKTLLSKEQNNTELCKFLESDKVLAFDRFEAVEWIMRVNSHYSFSVHTSVLAVNYLDRFLLGFMFQNNEEEKKKQQPWLTHLAAVACLSLACKMEETYVPLSVDLQVEDSKYVFEAKTIKRMEILVLSELEWKMNPVTPISFIDYITRRLGLKGYLCCEFLRRCESVLLSVFADSRLMCYLPSVLATATIMHVVNNVEPCLGLEYQNQLLGFLGINKDKVEECYNLVLELISEFKESKNKRKFVSIIPCSPNGVIDVSFSSDNNSNSNDSWEEVAATNTSVSSSPQEQDPLSKKARTQSQDQNKILLNHPNKDFLRIIHR